MKLLITRSKNRRIYGSQSVSFPATEMLPQWTHEEGAAAARMVAAHGLDDMGFPYARLTWLRLLPGLICQQHRPTLSPKHGTIPGETSRPPAGKLITRTCFHRGGDGRADQEGQRCVLTGMNVNSRRGPAFSACNASASTTAHRASTMTPHTAWLLSKEVISQQSGKKNGLVPMELTGITTPRHPGWLA